MCRAGKSYSPAAFVVPARTSPVAAFVMVTCALATTAPLGSVTTPVSSAFSCALAPSAAHRITAPTAINLFQCVTEHLHSSLPSTCVLLKRGGRSLFQPEEEQ